MILTIAAIIIVLSPSVQLVYLDSNQQYNKITYNATI